MKTLLWKIRFALEFRRLTKISFRWAWEIAGTQVESYGDEIHDWSPKDAAEDELDAWRSNC